MPKSAVVLVLLVATAFAVRVRMSDGSEESSETRLVGGLEDVNVESVVNPEELTGDALIDYINSISTTWTVGICRLRAVIFSELLSVIHR